jgi:hypothetical protein
MNDHEIIGQLEELARRIGIAVRYEPLKVEGFVHAGGFCRVRGKDVVIIHKKASAREKRQILVDALKRKDLSGVFLLPSLRKLLDREDGP